MLIFAKLNRYKEYGGSPQDSGLGWDKVNCLHNA